MYSLFLDDFRVPNTFLKDIRTWTVVRNYKEFVKTIKERGLPDFISFDHDLGPEHYAIFDILEALQQEEPLPKYDKIPYDKYEEKTGYHCALYLIEYCKGKKLPLPDYQVHSMNPVGAENIKKLLENYKKHQKKNANE